MPNIQAPIPNAKYQPQWYDVYIKYFQVETSLWMSSNKPSRKCFAYFELVFLLCVTPLSICLILML